MQRWPHEAEGASVAGVPEYRTEDGDIYPEGLSLPIERASLTVQGRIGSLALSRTTKFLTSH